MIPSMDHDLIDMPDYGTLNGQPVGPDLPPPVPCERCGHPVWLGQGVVAFKKAPSFHVFPDRDLRLELRSRLWELSLLTMPGSPWSLNPHACPKVEE